MTIVHPDFSKGPCIPQGDIVLLSLAQISMGHLAAEIAASPDLRGPQSGLLRLLEGEVTGHYHGFATPGMRNPPVMFRDDGLARDYAAVADVATGTARLVDCPKALAALENNGALTRRDLTIGFLLIEGGPADLSHPEHDTIRVPEGSYYVGRQLESSGADERIVQD